jgi:DNA-binding transcriptional ArsR family regulator
MELIGDAQLDATFAALADPTRRAIIARLERGEASVTELAEPFAMTQPAISKHLKVLEKAGLVSRRREAQRRPCRLQADALRGATEWLDAYRRHWAERYERLDALLDQLQPADHPEGPPP